MTSPVRLSASARADIGKAIAWHEPLRPGLGQRFREEIQYVIARISEHPEQYEMLNERFRRAFVRRFPYVVAYHFNGDAVLIIGVLPTRADPSLLARLSEQ